MKTTWKIAKTLITASLAILTVPLLVAFLTNAVPERKKIDESYEGTELSYFAADKWESEEARKDFNDVAYYFDDVDWSEYTSQILKACFNPGEAARIVEEELHIDPAKIISGLKSN